MMKSFPKHIWKCDHVKEVMYSRDFKIKSCVLQTENVDFLKDPRKFYIILNWIWLTVVHQVKLVSIILDKKGSIHLISCVTHSYLYYWLICFHFVFFLFYTSILKFFFCICVPICMLSETYVKHVSTFLCLLNCII